MEESSATEAQTPKVEVATGAVNSKQSSPETEAYIKNTCQQLRGWLGEEAADTVPFVENNDAVGSTGTTESDVPGLTFSERLSDCRGRSLSRRIAYAAACKSIFGDNRGQRSPSAAARHEAENLDSKVTAGEQATVNSNRGRQQPSNRPNNKNDTSGHDSVGVEQNREELNPDWQVETPGDSTPLKETSSALPPFTPENESIKVHGHTKTPHLTDSTRTDDSNDRYSASTDVASEEDMLDTFGLFGPRIRTWLQKTSDGPTVFRINNKALEGHSYAHDICTITGQLLEQVIQPETIMSPALTDAHESSWRQLNMTSGLQILRERQLRKDIAAYLKEDSKARETNALEQEPSKLVAFPSTDCLIRPATKEDAAAIGQMIESHRKIDYPCQFPALNIDSETMALQQLQSCLDLGWPFIVATSPDDELMERTNWPIHAGKAFEEYLKYKAEIPSSEKEILGLAFVRGFGQTVFGGPQLPMQNAGSICVLVQPNHRQKLVGTALLDRVLQSVAPYHRSVVDFQWKFSTTSGVYESLAANNQRQAVKMYVEYTTASGEEDPPWRSKMLEKFGFQHKVQLENVSRSDKRAQGNGWLDLHIWELKVQDPAEIM
ncbi:hypothetical protein VHEMI02103 [[Torrubiella] hemipterigena]|uniref:Uncharacterized protein n=1 Tax=[Torrubiella] hemipterigena TaxID=1531966 RepID=A0A0A1SUV2_9HYPO|nr:hypothetical protein VHEMI02103 [[Torrubiella] hemipterigena]